MSYIEREALLEHKRKMKGFDLSIEYWGEAVLCEDIRNAPTADVVEVRHGEWIEKPNPWGQDGSHTYVCSVCNEQISILGNALPYCSFCGAKMDGGREENEG